MLSNIPLLLFFIAIFNLLISLNSQLRFKNKIKIISLGSTLVPMSQIYSHHRN
ncbi:hypothetical protein AALP_AA5G222200 [Arabis alpina]|uniref:Uncharacterized protein n=1 Tax=Arabis alpina TaxID=50452 RepID=A0A087GYQ6_ARAAL|nr:hypothetical protein AALP_AA5G222200 [Arabis alpina]